MGATSIWGKTRKASNELPRSFEQAYLSRWTSPIGISSLHLAARSVWHPATSLRLHFYAKRRRKSGVERTQVARSKSSISFDQYNKLVRGTETLQSSTCL